MPERPGRELVPATPRRSSGLELVRGAGPARTPARSGPARPEVPPLRPRVQPPREDPLRSVRDPWPVAPGRPMAAYVDRLEAQLVEQAEHQGRDSWARRAWRAMKGEPSSWEERLSRE
jgi:hypothetical protein